MFNKKIKIVSGIVLGTMTVVSGSGLSNYPRTSVNKVLLANNSSKTKIDTLSNQSIDISNVWYDALFNIGFNSNNTFKITKGYASTNPYYNGNNSLIVILRNSKGQIIDSQTFKGGAYPENDIYNALNGKAFNYGDTIQITSNSNANFKVNGTSEKGTINYEITQNGLKTISANMSNLNALYNTNNTTTISGKTNANIPVYININNKISTVQSNDLGEFTYT
ncbi:MAG: hypothetical protein ACRC41_16265, partial [Sarcina sp.]